MDPGAIAAIILVLLMAMILLRLPVAVALFISGFIGYAWVDGWNRATLSLASTTGDLISGYALSVVPLFVLMGAVAARSGLSAELYRAALAMARPGARGTLARATIGASALFGAICGSSLATTATMTRIALPEMRAAGYSDELASGVLAAGGTLGILIPPSVLLIIYALLAEQSVPELFAAAFIPGILLVILFIVIIRLLIWFRPEWAPKAGSTTLTWRDRFGAIQRTWKVLSVFLVSIGGIYLGWFSPTEAAAIGAMMVILIGLLDRRLNLSTLFEAVRETATTSASLFFIFLGAIIYGRFITLTRLPNDLASFVDGLGAPAIVVGLIVVLIYLILGCVLESVSMVLITVPVFLPLMQSVGYDAVWFGILLTVSVEMGLITPPIGMNLFVIRGQAKDLATISIVRGAAYFLCAPIALIVLLLVWPDLTSFLPSLLLK